MSTATSPVTYTRVPIAEPIANPLRRAPAPVMRRVREYFLAQQFTYPALFERSVAAHAERAGQGVAPPKAGVDEVVSPDHAFGVLNAVFVEGRGVPWSVMRERIDEGILADLDALGLLRSKDVDAAVCLGSVLVTPIAGLYLAADHPYVAHGAPGLTMDTVYPALTQNTQKYMTLIPRTPCDAFLELCSGSGVAAIDAAPRTREGAWAADITERSTRFADWNAAFNGVTNAHCVQGDLYEPVRGMTFDRIVAHPPYMPNVEQTYIFRDGGADGEQITRRVIAELPEYLRPGGRFYCVCLATDRTEAPLQERLRGWLGARQDDFDVLVLELADPRDPTEFYAHAAYERGHGFAEVDERHRMFRELHVKRIVYSLIVLQRRREARPVFTVRRKASVQTASAHVEWMLAWEERMLRPASVRALLDATPDVPEDLELRIGQVRRQGEMRIYNCWLVTNAPLMVEAECPPWVALLFQRADGRRTGREHFAALQEAKVIPETVTEDDFASSLEGLVGLGTLVLPGHEPPPPRTPGSGLWTVP